MLFPDHRHLIGLSPLPSPNSWASPHESLRPTCSGRCATIHYTSTGTNRFWLSFRSTMHGGGNFLSSATPSAITPVFPLLGARRFERFTVGMVPTERYPSAQAIR